MAKIRVTWVKSCIGRPERQERTIRALGLRKLNQTVVHEDSPQVLGMVESIKHLVDWSSVEG